MEEGEEWSGGEGWRRVIQENVLTFFSGSPFLTITFYGMDRAPAILLEYSLKV
jgi:hypothetical protein